MTSFLRLQSSIDEPLPTGIYQTSPTSPPAKKQKMSLTQTYYVASTARTKLGREAGRSDHNLRRLVGHANLLDTLMVELADAERDQEAWFNQSVKKASKPEQPRHIQWIDTIDEDIEDDDSDLESDDGSDIYDEDVDSFYSLPLRRIRSPPVEISSQEIESDSEDDEDDDIYDDDYEEELSLTRVASIHSPPELTLDSDDSESSDDESMPASPEQVSYELSEKERKAIATTTTNFFNELKSSSPMEDIIMQQQQQQQPLIAAAC